MRCDKLDFPIMWLTIKKLLDAPALAGITVSTILGKYLYIPRSNNYNS
jgi:hypothetical protein